MHPTHKHKQAKPRTTTNIGFQGHHSRHGQQPILLSHAVDETLLTKDMPFARPAISATQQTTHPNAPSKEILSRMSSNNTQSPTRAQQQYRPPMDTQLFNPRPKTTAGSIEHE